MGTAIIFRLPGEVLAWDETFDARVAKISYARVHARRNLW